MRFALWLSLTLALGYAAFGPRFTHSSYSNTTSTVTVHSMTNGVDPVPPPTK